ncbi:Imm32 family immunity protein [Glycomyces paridis]|uniref:Uncharacterized protein n=1 Tax=Glycomyces paridis TaxID=2126555 RepID=A0A4V4HPN5_9ACTN|nr:hypothetical protein [Glycomyces paridis]THV30686.1 hypothetical protein E9998_04685 [Glycomyces paridis]
MEQEQVVGGPRDGERETRDIRIQIWPYRSDMGVVSWWESDTRLTVSVVDYSFGREIEIQGNRAGLISLARDLLTLAQEGAPNKSDILLDSDGLDGESETLRMMVCEPWGQ